MEHFLQYLEINDTILENKSLLIFLDYDGTLSPIVSDPSKAIPSLQVKTVLSKLSKITKINLVIISGRTLQNITNLLDMDNIIYVGNHGVEFGGLNTKFTMPLFSNWTNILQEMKTELYNDLASTPGILIEDKKFSLSVHYRSVLTRDVAMVKYKFNKIVSTYAKNNNLHVMAGKKVLEVVPDSSWNKGTISMLLLTLFRVTKDSNILPIYIGDDTTDEFAFQELKKHGITVVVGKRKSSEALFYLHNTNEVFLVLNGILTKFASL